MRIAVTGGSGFIGTNVVQQLQLAGHEVTVLDPLQPRAEGVFWKPIDIMRLEEVVEATKETEVIYHIAAVADVNQAFKDPLGCIDVNLRGTANVLEAARLNKTRRVIFASTVWVYQACSTPTATEATPLSIDHSQHLYTSSKIAGELLCHSYQQLYGVPFTILRYGIPYGPFMRQSLLIPIFVKKALAGESLSINGDGSQTRKFIYVEDLARGNVAALAPQAENQTYNLEGMEQITILQLAKMLDRIFGGVKIQFQPARPGDLSGGTEVDSQKALAELGWQPTISFEEGLRLAVAWLVTHSHKQQAVTVTESVAVNR
jgi:UDP-glucose 4-epimerase